MPLAAEKIEDPEVKMLKAKEQASILTLLRRKNRN
jgi:hypothetical protein